MGLSAISPSHVQPPRREPVRAHGNTNTPAPPDTRRGCAERYQPRACSRPTLTGQTRSDVFNWTHGRRRQTYPLSLPHWPAPLSQQAVAKGDADDLIFSRAL
ncbi:hypothetical protein Bbelb_141430 [Branchiostoma belcheri]|nr:hypothetical protein Bbelb_141430 [Branchiostoma belcheri]